MSSNEVKIVEFLRTMGYTVQLLADTGTADLKYADIVHMGVNIRILKDREIFVAAQAGLGFVPKQNVAPFFRRLLELHSVMGGPYFAIGSNNWLNFNMCRQLDGLELVEFRVMLDTLATNYWQRVAGLIQEFQVPQQPS